jgi:TRAP-type C4-dicarboxylate transport system permease small subunit
MTRLETAVQNGFKYVCATILAMMVLIVFVNTVLRYCFHSGITMNEELLRYLFVWVSFLSIIVVYKNHGHLGVTLLSERLKGRAKIVLKILTNALILYAMYFLTRGGVINMENSATTIGQTTGIPFNWIILSSMIAAVSIAGLTLAETIGLVRRLVRGGEA